MEEKTDNKAITVQTESDEGPNLPVQITITSECTDADVETTEEIAEKGKKHKKHEALRLIALLLCILLSAVWVTAFGITVAEKYSADSFFSAEKLIANVLGTGVVKLGVNPTWPPLVRVPGEIVSPDTPPGAAEDEKLPEEEIPPIVGDLPIMEIDLSASSVTELINATSYIPDTDMLLTSPLATPTTDAISDTYGSSAPAVLIIHTHGTEAYAAAGQESYNDDDIFRSYDTDENVVAVGREMARIFRAHGIPTIHIETMFDAEDYNRAYEKSAAAVRELTKRYPSIKYVFDVHRDAMFTSEGVCLKPTSDTGAAQVMLVVGTDEAGSGHATWKGNLGLALKIQQSAAGFDPKLMRGINLRRESFNQQITAGSLLVEVGAAANNLDEAKLAGKIFAEAVVRAVGNE